MTYQQSRTIVDYERPWLLVDKKWKLISRYASPENARDAAAMYSRRGAYRVIHVDELDEARRVSMHISISKGTWP
jgi:hypothetical protein